MFEVVSNDIRDFQYSVSDENHIQFLKLAFNIGLLPSDPEPRFLRKKKGTPPKYLRMATFLEGESIRVVSLIADNDIQQEFVFYGLKIGLFSSSFLDYLVYGLEPGQVNLASEDISTIRLIMQGVELALCEGFGLPSTQIEAPCKKTFGQ